MATMREDLAEKHLRQQLRVQRETMLRRGIDPSLAEREVKAVETAIRVALWRTVLIPEGAA